MPDAKLEIFLAVKGSHTHIIVGSCTVFVTSLCILLFKVFYHEVRIIPFQIMKNYRQEVVLDIVFLRFVYVYVIIVVIVVVVVVVVAISTVGVTEFVSGREILTFL